MRKNLLTILFILCCGIGRADASTLDARQNLSFGTLIPVANSGSVIVSTAGAVNTGGNVTVAPSGTSYYQGKVRFTPTLLNVFTVRAADSSIVLNNTSSGGGSVTVDNFTVNPSSLNITVLGAVDINIGGRMTFSASSKSGTYTGSVRIEVSSLLAGTLSVNLPVTLTLWDSLKMNETTPLFFGVLEISSGASVVQLNAQTGQRSVVSGSGNVVLSTGQASTAGRFKIKGQPNTSVSVALPSSVVLTGNKGGTMTLDNFNGYPSSTQLSLDSSGDGNLNVGANLNIGASQLSGTYNGTYSVTVNY
ncbi:MAG: DUF4402 domain-containing protein [Alphaproteobacteria bacterium]|nr:DUF4402 domain-containing protein [Alphaproteobacteria bacterium]